MMYYIVLQEKRAKLIGETQIFALSSKLVYTNSYLLKQGIQKQVLHLSTFHVWFQ